MFEITYQINNWLHILTADFSVWKKIIINKTMCCLIKVFKFAQICVLSLVSGKRNAGLIFLSITVWTKKDNFHLQK